MVDEQAARSRSVRGREQDAGGRACLLVDERATEPLDSSHSPRAIPEAIEEVEARSSLGDATRPRCGRDAAYIGAKLLRIVLEPVELLSSRPERHAEPFAGGGKRRSGRDHPQGDLKAR